MDMFQIGNLWKNILRLFLMATDYKKESGIT
jgi:hypothetical protein